MKVEQNPMVLGWKEINLVLLEEVVSVRLAWLSSDVLKHLVGE